MAELSKAQREVLTDLARGGQLRNVGYNGPWWLAKSGDQMDGFKVNSSTVKALALRGLLVRGYESFGSIRTYDINEAGRSALTQLNEQGERG
jgi:hypothetical protein